MIFFAVTVALASATVLAGVAQRVTDHWQPQGDDAAIAFLTNDVFTARSPLLGMPSTLGGGSHAAHHWGPLLFWVLAAPQKLASGNPVGLQVGLLLLELAAITCVAVFTYRRLGRLGALTILVLLGLLTWSLGRQIVSSIWNPDIAVLPLVALFVLVWSAADGDTVAWPFLAFAASFVVQCNLLYTPFVAALMVWAIVGLALTHRERRAHGTTSSRPAHRRIWITAGLVLVACWSAPIIQELTHRPGNIELVLQNGTGETGQHVGLVRTFYLLVHTIGVVPFWSHPMSGSSEAFFGIFKPASVLTTVTALGLGLAVIGGLVWTWRREPTLRSLLGTAAFGFTGAAIVVARLPVSFGVGFYRLRGVWVTGMFVWFAFIILVARVVALRLSRGALSEDRGSNARSRQVVAVILGALLVLVAALGATSDTPRSLISADSSAVVSRIVDTARRKLPTPGPYLASGSAPLIGFGVLWGLQRHGFDIRVTKKSSRSVAQYIGESHGPEGQKLQHLLLIADAAANPPSRGQKIVYATPAGSMSHARHAVARSHTEACKQLTADPPRITAGGRRLLRDHARRRDARDRDLRSLAGYAGGATPCRLIDSGLGLAGRSAIELSSQQEGALFALTMAESNLKIHDVALYVGPP